MAKKLICFDVDGTVADIRRSWGDLTLGLGCRPETVAEIYEKTEKGLMAVAEGVDILTKMYQKSDKAERNYIESLFGDTGIRPEAVELASYLKQKDYLIYLVSGSLDLRVKAVAQQMGADDYYAHASLEYDVSGRLLKINYNGQQRSAKGNFVRELSHKLGIPLGEITFVGDSENDLEAFLITGRGIAVAPYDENIGRAAWKKVSSLLEIKEILA